MAQIIARVAAGANDASYYSSSTYNTTLYWRIGKGTYYYGSCMRVQVNLPQGTTIESAYLNVRAQANGSSPGNVRSQIAACDVDDATMPTSPADFDTKWGQKTTAVVNWDSFPTWVLNTDYTSPDIGSVIQEIISRPGWVSGNYILLFWNDRGPNRATVNGNISAYSYEGSAANAPAITINYSSTTALGLPANPWAEYDSEADETTVSWDAVENAVSYEIYSGDTLDPTTLLGTSETNSYVHATPPDATTYYRIIAVGDGSTYSDSGYSANALCDPTALGKNKGREYTSDGYEVHPIKAWCADGISAGDAMYLPTFRSRFVTTHLLSGTPGNFTQVPCITFKDAVIFPMPNAKTSSQYEETYSLGFKDGTPNDDWTVFPEATITGNVISGVGGFKIVKLTAGSGEITANGVVLPLVEGDVYSVVLLGNSTTELLYVFDADGKLFFTDTIATAPARSTLTFTGNVTFTTGTARRGGAKSHRVVHYYLEETDIPPLTGLNWSQDYIIPSKDGNGVFFASGASLYYRDNIAKSNQRLIKDFSDAGTGGEKIPYIFQADDGRLYVNIIYPISANSDWTYNLSQASEVWRCDTITPGANWTKVITMPYDASYWVACSASCVSGFTQTAGGRIWVSTYGNENGATGQNHPTMYWSDDNGVTWSDLGDLNATADNPWKVDFGAGFYARHIESVFVDKTTNTLHCNIGDPGNSPTETPDANGWTIDTPTMATLDDADAASPAWSDFVLMTKDTAGVQKQDFRPAETAQGLVVWATDRDPNGICATKKIDGTWHQLPTKFMNGRYNTYGINTQSDNGMITLVASGYYNIPSTSEQSELYFFQSDDGEKYQLVFEGVPGYNSGSVTSDHRYGFVSWNEGSRYSYLPYFKASDTSNDRKADRFDTYAFTYQGKWLTYTLSGNDVVLDWSNCPDFVGPYNVYQGDSPVVPETSPIYTGNDKTYTITNGIGDYFRVVSANAFNEIHATATTAPAAPTSITATEDGNHIDITWENVEVENGYYLQRKVDSGSYVTIATLGPDENSYVDSTFPGGTHTYTYQVAAFNDIDQSDWVESSGVSHTSASTFIPIIIFM